MSHYLSYFDLLKKFEQDTPRRFLPVSTDIPYEWVDYGEDEGRIITSINSPAATPYLYRGQTAKITPCLPTLFRGMDFVNNLYNLNMKQIWGYYSNRARMFEFFDILREHPAVLYSKKIKLHVDLVAIAQHYGFKTECLDMSESPAVAGFFATHEWQGNRYSPLYKGVGVIYRIEWPSRMKTKAEVLTCPLEVIGYQVMPRPTEQKAWVYKLRMGQDFERQDVEIFTFDRDHSCTSYLTDLFNNGEELFPEDELAGLANSIIHNPFISEDHFILAMQSEGVLDDQIRKTIKQINATNPTTLTVKKRKTVRFQKKQLKKMEKTYSEKCDYFLTHVAFRPVFSPNVEENF